MDEMIQTSDAAQAPQGNPEIPVENASIETPAGTEGNLFPLGGGETITNIEGLPAGQTAPLMSEEPVQTQEVVQTEDPVREDPSRMEYWQSQTDKAKNENYKLQEEIQYYRNSLGPVAEMIQRNPQVLNNLEGINGNPGGNPVQAENQQNSLEKPIRPTKPTTYNEVDAYNDPESDSFKYRSSNDEWRDDMFDWRDRVDTARMEHGQQVAQKQQKNQMMQSAYSHAINNYGMKSEQAADFVRWSQDSNNITVDNLIRLYALKDAPQRQQQAQVQTRTADMKTQQERLKVPRPTTVQTGQSAPTLTEEESFSNALLTNARR